MEISLFLAKLLGLYCVIMAVSMLVRTDFWRSMLADYLKIPALFGVSAFINIIFGLLIVLSHNIWEWSWQVVITIIGWLSLLKGLYGLFFIESIRSLVNRIKDSNWLTYLAIFSLLIGLFLIYYGFLNKFYTGQ
jgi:hypothetical protein